MPLKTYVNLESGITAVLPSRLIETPASFGLNPSDEKVV
jgi:hypothetical protein